MKKLTTLAATCACFLAGAGTLNSSQLLSLQISPVVMPSPGFVSIRATVEASDENRRLEIVAQSPEFFRSSSIDLDGRSAPRLSVVQYPNLPPGLYEVSAVLVGSRGMRATASRVVRVVPTPGSRR